MVLVEVPKLMLKEYKIGRKVQIRRLLMMGILGKLKKNRTDVYNYMITYLIISASTAFFFLLLDFDSEESS